MVEIYNRDPGDYGYKEGILETTDPIEICIGQLKMLLLTNKGEVLGDPGFGIGLDDLVFNLELSEDSIKREINFQINTYCKLFFDLGGYFKLEFYQGTLRDIANLYFFIPSYSTQSPAISLQVI
jgi:hypothetical protein